MKSCQKFFFSQNSIRKSSESGPKTAKNVEIFHQRVKKIFMKYFSTENGSKKVEFIIILIKQVKRCFKFCHGAKHYCQ
jgi:hypothetical protein